MCSSPDCFVGVVLAEILRQYYLHGHMLCTVIPPSLEGPHAWFKVLSPSWNSSTFLTKYLLISSCTGSYKLCIQSCWTYVTFWGPWVCGMWEKGKAPKARYQWDWEFSRNMKLELAVTIRIDPNLGEKIGFPQIIRTCKSILCKFQR